MLVLPLGVPADPGTYCFTIESEPKLTSRYYRKIHFVCTIYIQVHMYVAGTILCGG